MLRPQKPYQIQASNQLSLMPYALLNYPMGTGKTKIALDALSLTLISHAIVITKASLLSHWEHEVILEGLQPFIYAGNKRETILESFLESDNGILISSFHPSKVSEIVHRLQFDKLKHAMKRKNQAEDGTNSQPTTSHLPSHLIIDESHILANPYNQTTHEIWKLANYFNSIWLMTGTPIQNAIEDIFPTLTLLKVFQSSLDSFREQFMKVLYTFHNTNGTFAKWEAKPHAIEEINKLLQPVILQMGSNDLKPTIHTHHISLIELPSLTRKMQEVKKLIKLDERPLPYITQWRLLGSAMQYEGTETKRYQAIRDLVISLQHGVFIVTAFQTIASELLLMLSHEGIQSSLISGKVSLTKRDEILKTLSTQPHPILIGVNQAVREGLNIPFIQNLIWLDTTWNNPSESQIRDRIRRITSHYESINEFYLSSQNSPEPWMLNIRNRKQKETNNLTVQGGY